jgi:hypothetical protein
MKKIIFILSIVMISSCSFAGTTPEAVLNAFKQKFPAATNVNWGKESATEYEAEFKINGTKKSANFSVDGTWLETETEIPSTQLPVTITDAIKKQYPNWKIIGADKIESSKKGIMYEADIKSGLKKKEVVLNSDGTFAK